MERDLFTEEQGRGGGWTEGGGEMERVGEEEEGEKKSTKRRGREEREDEERASRGEGRRGEGGMARECVEEEGVCGEWQGVGGGWEGECLWRVVCRAGVSGEREGA